MLVKKLIKENYAVKKINKCVTVFDHIDKILILLSTTSGKEYIISFLSVVGAPVGIASESFTLICSLTTGIIKSLLGTATSKKKKHDEVLMFFFSISKNYITLTNK